MVFLHIPMEEATFALVSVRSTSYMLQFHVIRQFIRRRRERRVALGIGTNKMCIFG